MEELGTGKSSAASHTQSLTFAVSRAASFQWAAMSSEKRRTYNEAAERATPAWHEQRAVIDAQLRATGHPGLPAFRHRPAVTSTRLYRIKSSPTSRESYLASIGPELAAAIKAHPRRAPYGLNMYAREQACKHGSRLGSSTNVCASGADYHLAVTEWKLMAAAQRQPWEEEGKIARQLWSEQRAQLDERLKAAGHPPFPWNKPRAKKPKPAAQKPTPHPVKRYVLLTDPALLQAVASHPRQPPTHHKLFLSDFARSLGSDSSQPHGQIKHGELTLRAAEKWRQMSTQQQQPYLDRGQEAILLWRETKQDVEARLSAGGHASFHFQSLAMRPAPSYEYIKGRLASLHKEQPSEKLRILIEQVEVGCRVLLPNQHEPFRKVGCVQSVSLLLHFVCLCCPSLWNNVTHKNDMTAKTCCFKKQKLL